MSQLQQPQPQQQSRLQRILEQLAQQADLRRKRKLGVRQNTGFVPPTVLECGHSAANIQRKVVKGGKAITNCLACRNEHK